MTNDVVKEMVQAIYASNSQFRAAGFPCCEFEEAAQAAYDNALANFREKQQWQPIETAPKDEIILMWLGLPLLPAIGRWWGKVGNTNYNCWANVYGRNVIDMKPTHWMPLPEPPALVDAAGAE